MNIEMLIDGQPVVKIDVDLHLILHQLAAASNARADARSTPASEPQMRNLLSRIDQRSVDFLKAIACTPEGTITWKDMRSIFGIMKKDDWPAYSGSFGKGITRAYRRILGDNTAKLVWWNDPDWEAVDWDDDMCAVFIDGPALDALRAASAA